MTRASVESASAECCRFIEDDNDEASRGQPATRMMSTCSTRASSDNESDASRSQRQAVGGAPQARSGVERDNQRRKNGGMRKVARSSVQMTLQMMKHSPAHPNKCNRCGDSVADNCLR